MHNNMTLISEINGQREANRVLKNQIQADIGRIRHLIQAMNNGGGGGAGGGGKHRRGSGSQAVSSSSAPGPAAGGKSGSAGGGISSLATGFPMLGGGNGKGSGAYNMGTMAVGLFLDDASGPHDDELEPSELLERNRRRVLALRDAIAQLEARAQSAMQKAYSKEMLPPMDGGSSSGVGSMNNFLITDGSMNQGNTPNDPNLMPQLTRSGSANNSSKNKSVGIALPPVHKEKLDIGGNLLPMLPGVTPAARPLSSGTIDDGGIAVNAWDAEEDVPVSTNAMEASSPTPLNEAAGGLDTNGGSFELAMGSNVAAHAIDD